MGSHARSKRQRITNRIIRTKQHHKVRCELKYIREGVSSEYFYEQKNYKKGTRFLKAVSFQQHYLVGVLENCS